MEPLKLLILFLFTGDFFYIITMLIAVIGLIFSVGILFPPCCLSLEQEENGQSFLILPKEEHKLQAEGNVFDFKFQNHKKSFFFLIEFSIPLDDPLGMGLMLPPPGHQHHHRQRQQQTAKSRQIVLPRKTPKKPQSLFSSDLFNQHLGGNLPAMFNKPKSPILPEVPSQLLTSNDNSDDDDEEPQRRFACSTRLVDEDLAKSGQWACCGDELYNLMESACIAGMVMDKHTIPPPPSNRNMATTRLSFRHQENPVPATTTPTADYGGNQLVELEQGVTIKCGSKSFELSEKDEEFAEFFKCCGDRLYDSRRFACMPASTKKKSAPTTTTTSTTTTSTITASTTAGMAVELEVPEIEEELILEPYGGGIGDRRLKMWETMINQAREFDLTTRYAPVVASTTTELPHTTRLQTAAPAVDENRPFPMATTSRWIEFQPSTPAVPQWVPKMPLSTKPMTRLPTVSVICGESTRYEIDREEVHRYACCGERLYDTTKFACEK